MKLTASSKIVTGLAVGTLLLLTGCETETETRTVDAKGPDVINTSAINSQDWANAADQLLNSLLSSDALNNAPRKPAILAVHRIINNTSLMVDTDLLINGQGRIAFDHVLG